MARRGPPFDGGAAGGVARASPRRGSPSNSRELHLSLRRDISPERRGSEIGRVSFDHRNVDDSGGALLPVDRRIPAIKAHRGV